MLWTDRIFVTLDDLQRVDSEVADVADAEKISLPGNTGLVRGAIEEASHELQKYLVSFGGYSGSGDFSANHLAAVYNTGGAGAGTVQKIGLSQVVVSGNDEYAQTQLKHWVVFWVLQIFYRDAFNRTVKDRYEGKMRYYKTELARRLTPGMLGVGIPTVVSPLAAPAATFEFGAGTWGTRNLSLTAGSGTIDERYDFAITYADMSAANLYVSPAVRHNAESCPSERATVLLAHDKVVVVSIASLTPPSGAQHPSQAVICPVSALKATHWNVYAGKTGEDLYLQNQTPIAIGTTSYTLSGNPAASGYSPGLGQYATGNHAIVPSRKRA